MDGRVARTSRTGTASAVLDFSNAPGELPEPKILRTPRWPGTIAHVRIGDSTICVPRGGPDDAVDLRCGSCRAEAVVVPDPLTRTLIYIVRHQPGCEAFEDLMGQR